MNTHMNTHTFTHAHKCAHIHIHAKILTEYTCTQACTQTHAHSSPYRKLCTVPSPVSPPSIAQIYRAARDKEVVRLAICTA